MAEGNFASVSSVEEFIIEQEDKNVKLPQIFQPCLHFSSPNSCEANLSTNYRTKKELSVPMK